MSGEMVFPRSRPVRSAIALAALAAVSSLAGSAAAVETNTAGLKSCSELNTATPAERVWCRTETATLVIAHQSDPILLDGTEVRVLSGELSGSRLRVRTRVRNTTEAEQGLSAGGQELYLTLDGARVDLAVFRDVRFDAGEAKTIQLDYDLAPDHLAALHGRNGRFDFGVRPWHDGTLPASLVGVVRMRVGL